jgi:crossover junction endodeoxyribonuclease RuvC
VKSDKFITSDKLPNSSNLYVGIDQSLKYTAVSIFKSNQLSVYRIRPLYMGVSRIAEIYDRFEDILDFWNADQPIYGAAIEGYAFGGQGAIFNLGELGGILRLALYKRNIRTIEVPPAHLKKSLTGVGNAKKELMIKELYKKYNVDVDDNNDCDAVALSIAAKEYFETELHLIKAYRTDAHKACKQIIGQHPKPLTHKEYFLGMPNVTVSEYEKMRKQKKKEIDSE